MLKDDIDFNYEIVINIMYINSKPILYIIDTATAFQAARFLKDIILKCVWDTLCLCQINTYFSLPNTTVINAGKQLTSSKFKQNAKAMTIEVKEVPVKAYNLVGKVKVYYLLL